MTTAKPQTRPVTAHPEHSNDVLTLLKTVRDTQLTLAQSIASINQKFDEF